MDDKTIMIPAIPNDVMAKREETEAEKLAEARNHGITMGLVIMFLIFAICVAGIGLGAFLTRVLAL